MADDFRCERKGDDMMKIGLRYIGNGSIRGVPARNLTIKEVAKYGGEDYLISTNMYEKPVANKIYSGGSENKEVNNERN